MTSGFTMNSGYKPGDLRDVTVTPISEGVLSVAPKSVLGSGEYLLDVGGNSGGALSYDFGINPGQ